MNTIRVPMRILLASDLHLDMLDDPSLVVDRLTKDCDVVVLAGDISGPTSFAYDFQDLRNHFGNDTPILMVMGNHDHWSNGGHRKGQAERCISDCMEAAEKNGIVVLYRDEVKVKGFRFIGTTLWYPDTPAARMMSKGFPDFRFVNGDFIFNRARRDKSFLQAEADPETIVVTHHSPSYLSVPEKYQGDAWNCFFVHDCEKLIMERQPLLWLHGHTHDAFDYQIGNTRVVCNPCGYAGEWGQNGFDGNKIIEVELPKIDLPRTCPACGMDCDDCGGSVQ